MASAPNAARLASEMVEVDRREASMADPASPVKCNLLPDRSIAPGKRRVLARSSPGRRDLKNSGNETGMTRNALSSLRTPRLHETGRRLDMFSANRRTLLHIASATAIVAALGTAASSAGAQDKIRIGYAISKTGP